METFEKSDSRILDLNGNQVSLEGKEVFLKFRKTVESLGLKIAGQKQFADHAVIDLALLPRGHLYLCAEKDAVKLPKSSLPIFYLEMQMEVVQGIEKWEKLVEKIDQKIDNRSIYE